MLFSEAGMRRLYLLKAGINLEGVTDNDAMRLGREIELGVLRCADLDIVCYQPEYSTGEPLHLVVHPDALCRDGWLVEVKTTGLVGRSDWPEGDVPERVLYQVQAQLLASGAPGCMVVALIGGRGLRKYMIRPERLLQSLIEKRIRLLWEHVDSGVAPFDDGEGDIFPIFPTNREVVITDEGIRGCVSEYMSLKAEIRSRSAELERLRDQIEHAVGDAEVALCGEYVVKRRVVRQLRLDTSGLVTVPSNYKETSYVRFDVSRREGV